MTTKSTSELFYAFWSFSRPTFLKIVHYTQQKVWTNSNFSHVWLGLVLKDILITNSLLSELSFYDP